MSMRPVVQLPGQPRDRLVQRVEQARRFSLRMYNPAVEVERDDDGHPTAVRGLFDPGQQDVDIQNRLAGVSLQVRQLPHDEVLDTDTELAAHHQPGRGENDSLRTHTSTLARPDEL